MKNVGLIFKADIETAEKIIDYIRNETELIYAVMTEKKLKIIKQQNKKSTKTKSWNKNTPPPM